MDAKKLKGLFISYIFLTLCCIGFLIYFTAHNDNRSFTFVILSLGNAGICIRYYFRYRKAKKKHEE